MNSESTENELGSQDTAFLIDSGIFRMLGFRHEIQEGVVKMWPRDVEVPDETNWVVAHRFTEHLGESMGLLTEMGVTVETHEEDGWHWAELTVGEGSGITTDEFPTVEIAVAAGLYGLLYSIRKVSQS